MILNELAPVCIFVYNRLEHTVKTIEALKKNNQAKDTLIYIFSEGSKGNSDSEKVQEVRDYINTISGFKSISIIEKKRNYGLAYSIINGVTEVIRKHGKVIVLEDDIVTSPAFLSFMNQSLDYYQEKKQVWHISGWSYPIPPGKLGDVFFWRVMNCWGWATWSNRWEHFKKEPGKLKSSFSNDDIYTFDLDGSGVFWHQIKENHEGKINTWAIFWYATIYQNKGLCVNPTISYTNNIGFDGTGTNCPSNKNIFKENRLNFSDKIVFEDKLVESELAVNRIKKYYKASKPNMFIRIINKISRMLFNKNIIQ